MSEWISAKDRMPDSSQRVLVFTPTNNLSMAYRIIPEGFFKQVATDATHWMPLPEPPEDV